MNTLMVICAINKLIVILNCLCENKWFAQINRYLNLVEFVTRKYVRVCHCTFPIDFSPDGILFGDKSIGKV